MMKCIKLDLKKIFIGKRFLIAVIGIALGMLLNFMADSKMAFVANVETYITIGFDQSFFLLVYLLCVLPAGISHCIDYKSGVYRYEIVRCSARSYSISKTVAAVVGGFLATTTGLFLSICEAAVLTIVKNKSVSNLVFDKMMMEQQIWRILIFTLLCAVISETAFTVSCFIPNLYVTIVMPMVLFWTFNSNIFSFLPNHLQLKVIYFGKENIMSFGYALIISVFLIALLHQLANYKIIRRMENG